ncbi:MAG TPA: hypothetical protein VGX50_10625, partial [Longimicrobium sp.]|nr:hypothetical protein [Longimicrobium sp.]
EAHIRVRMQARAHSGVFAVMAPVLARLVRAEEVTVEAFSEAWSDEQPGATVLDPDFRLLLQLSAADAEKEISRMREQLERKRARLASVHQRLANPEFLSNAPERVVQGTVAECEALEREVADLELRCSGLGVRSAN